MSKFEAYLQEKAKQVADQIKKQVPLEFSVKEQANRLDSLGCISQLATVTVTLSSMTANLNTLIVIVNRMKTKSDVREGKLVDEGASSGVVGREIPFSPTLITFSSRRLGNVSGNRRENRLEVKLPKLDFLLLMRLDLENGGVNL